MNWKAMNWKKKVASGWLWTLWGVALTAVLYGVCRAVWESPERNFFIGALAVFLISMWALYEVME
jgi:TRAP-type C4-dicarboxylate transport system permease large subunit